MKINIFAARKERKRQALMLELHFENMKKMHANIDELSRKGWK